MMERGKSAGKREIDSGSTARRRKQQHMRILFLTDCYLPHAGGARVYYHNLYRELVRNADNHVTILTSKVPGWQTFDRMESGERLRIVRIGSTLENWKYDQYPNILPP